MYDLGDYSLLVPLDLELPMAHRPKFDMFYSRVCFPVYYDHIMKALEENRYVTLTGTPGIGKSVFYNYFFQRYRKEHPSKTIVAAAFTNDNEFKSCVLFEGEGGGVELDKVPLNKGEDTIYLYDGPPSPNLVPSGKMVCFTSPNERFFRSMKNVEVHIAIYLPPWDLDELCEVYEDDSLELKEIENRFYLFGGIVRFCLAINQSFCDNAKEELLANVRTIKTYEQVKELLDGTTNRPDIAQQIFHYVPKPLPNGLPALYEWNFCSRQISRMLYAQIEDRSEMQSFFASRTAHA